jgi:hypothetical protein
MEKNLPISQQFFEGLRQNNSVYVDKTEHIYKLISIDQINIFQFLSRPHRFGKSLLISTLYQLFRGNKALFKGLWIEDKWDWEKDVYPVIWIDFNSIGYVQADLGLSLQSALEEIAQEYDVEIAGQDAKEKFKNLIQKLHEKTGKTVVLLIDEYDKPLIDFAGRPDKAEKLEYHKDTLKSFYSTLKSIPSQYLKYTLITGVAKIGKLSIFSDLNHLDDMTLAPQCATLLGFTEDELKFYFKEYLEEFASYNQMTLEESLEEIKRWYDGYSFDGITHVYAPFSTLRVLDRKILSNFWFETGTPTFLINLLKQNFISALDIETARSNHSLMESNEIESLNPISLMFQTGYLTIERIEKYKARPTYYLSYPNQEVRESMQQHLLASYIGQSAGGLKTLLLDKMETALAGKDIDKMMSLMKVVFSKIPYQIFIDLEAYYHSVVYLVFKLLGSQIQAEKQTNIGRMDAVLEYQNLVYIFEFKQTTAQKGLDQIHEKQYYQPYQHQDKGIILVGVAFDDEKNNIGEWKVEEL